MRHATRRDLLLRVLARDLADRLELVPSVGGLHVSALARTASVEQLDAIVRRASSAGVEVQRLSSFAVGPPARSGVLLGYGAIPAERIEEGLRRLRACFAG